MKYQLLAFTAVTFLLFLSAISSASAQDRSGNSHEVASAGLSNLGQVSF